MLTCLWVLKIFKFILVLYQFLNVSYTNFDCRIKLQLHLLHRHQQPFLICRKISPFRVSCLILIFIFFFWNFFALLQIQVTNILSNTDFKDHIIVFNKQIIVDLFFFLYSNKRIAVFFLSLQEIYNCNSKEIEILTKREPYQHRLIWILFIKLKSFLDRVIRNIIYSYMISII